MNPFRHLLLPHQPHSLCAPQAVGLVALFAGSQLVGMRYDSPLKAVAAVRMWSSHASNTVVTVMMLAGIPGMAAQHKRGGALHLEQ